MYNLVSCYDSLEMRVRGDVLSDKVTPCQSDILSFLPGLLQRHGFHHRAGGGEALPVGVDPD